MKIVIIDDERRIISLLKHLIPFKDLGLVLSGEAENGVTALDLCYRVEPDIILTDIRMPGMDGLSLINKIKEMLPLSIIIIISGFDEFEYAQKALKLGVFDYILKPVDENEITKVLTKAVGVIKNTKNGIKNNLNIKKQIRKLQGDYISLNNKDEIKYTGSNVLITKAISYISENYNTDISLVGMADMVYISPHYFSELFKKTLGIGFAEYITKMRMAKAEELLLQPEFKIKEISNIVGYHDTSYFIRVFKNLYKMSPTAYRIKILGK